MLYTDSPMVATSWSSPNRALRRYAARAVLVVMSNRRDVSRYVGQEICPTRELPPPFTRDGLLTMVPITQFLLETRNHRLDRSYRL